jgi:hypothetical protein
MKERPNTCWMDNMMRDERYEIIMWRILWGGQSRVVYDDVLLIQYESVDNKDGIPIKLRNGIKLENMLFFWMMQ